VLAITTDNASNNSTLMARLSQTLRDSLDLNAAVPSMALNPKIQQLLHIPTYIPCLAHVIQLSVQSLLKTLKASATNNNLNITWEDSVDIQHGSQSGLPFTLEKV
jgi:hypothetical protein